MRVRIEIDQNAEEEVVIHCKEWNDEAGRLQAALEDALRQGELPLTAGDALCFVPIDEILFFETDGDAVKVHTRDGIYTSGEKLYRLEQMLPRRFARVSKSCILNSAAVVSLSRGVTGTAVARFSDTTKEAYVSRMYYKALETLIYETRVLT